MQLERILVALKPWERALPLTPSHAQQLTQHASAQVRLVTTVFDSAVAARSERGDIAALAVQERAVLASRVELERLARTLRNGARLVTAKAVWGVPAYEGIAAAAREWPADLLVIGAHEAQSAHTRLTDTDWQLMRHVSCPLLLVKRAAFAGYERIVAVVDPLHAAADKDVVRASRRFARAFDSTLVVVDVNAREPGRETGGSASLLVLRVPSGAAREADVATAAEMAVNSAPGDVLLVPGADCETAVGRLQVG